MSIEHMTAVWKYAPFDQTTLLVLLCLADYADDGGRSWPSVSRIAERARCSERHVSRVLSELEESGWLTRTPRPGHSTTYTVVIRGDKMAPLPPVSDTPELRVVTGGDPDGTLGVTPVAGITTKEPSIEPSKNRQPRKRATPFAIPADWEPSEKSLEWALGTTTMSSTDLMQQTREMVKFFSRPDSVKRNAVGWERTWQNWITRTESKRVEQEQKAGGARWW